ncbi:MAG TPA: hypothetical protein VL485_02620 [Ktedonobacteraceae bacterium]|jgi:hypothetical protein|nr:hypothetical protein [Ktedonobacteraceae bacterium]
MSIELWGFPTVEKPLSSKDIWEHLETLLGASAGRLLGEQPQLLHLGSHRVVQEDEMLTPDSYYSFHLAVPTTLSLGMSVNKKNSLDEQDFLEEYGRNLTPEKIQRLVEAWKAIGYTFSIITGAGRSPDEPLLFVCLAAALAFACEGYVINTGDYGYIQEKYGLEIGVYTAEEFSRAIPKS